MSNVPATTSDALVEAVAEPAWRYEQAVKNPDVEEWIDLHWHRRLAFQLIRPLQHSSLPVTPTHLTMVSLLLGIAASTAYFYAGTHGAWLFAAGTALLLASIVFDCSDGMLARLKGTSSEFGMLLDGLVDFVVGLGVWLGLGHSTTIGMDPRVAWPALVALFLAIIAHVAYYDHLKNIYVRLTTPKAQRKPIRRSVSVNAVARFANFFYENWYGRMSAAICGDDIAHLEHVESDDAKRELFRAMRLSTWLGVGLHFFVMYVAALAAMAYPSAPLYVAVFGIVGVLNVVMVWTVIEQRRAARRLREAQ